MAKLSRYPTESHSFRDPDTGARVRQVTDHASIHHHPFYYLPAYSEDGNRLFFVSHRHAHAELFYEERSSGDLVQLTVREDLNEWSVHPAHDAPYVYFTAGASALRVNINTGEEEQLADFGAVPMREAGMVGAAMGTTTLSRDDRWWCVPVRMGDASELFVIDTKTGECDSRLRAASIGHPQFHPNNSDMLRYAGPHSERIWTIQRSGAENRLAYKRDVSKREWIVHETWVPGRNAIYSVNWPHGVFHIDLDTGGVGWVTEQNAWHPMVNHDGSLMVSDTVFPDRGLILFDPRIRGGETRALCQSGSSNQGAHWETNHCPYDDGPVDVYAPQHTHPHPSFSPDGHRVVFTSDKTGYSQLYEVEIPEDLSELPLA